MKNYQKSILVLIMVSVLLCGCQADKNPDVSEYREHTAEELNNLAQIEIYSAKSHELIKVISDKEMLYRWNQCVGIGFDDSDLEGQQEELEKSIEGLEEQYDFISYKYPASQFRNQELEENIIITLYENTNIIKMTVSQESIKGAYIPQEFLEFYYSVPDEDMEFYRSFIEE
ncbi:MAG: hypothetical protein HDR01_13635 [Lachnospiraceae bacterium]|nr:hypothetical protein [Lachnospiraceae bacterium]